MNTFTEKLSGLLLNSINSLSFSNPIRTSLGVLLGYVLSCAFTLFKPWFQSYGVVDWSGNTVVGWIAFGVLILHLPYYVWSVFNKSEINEKVDGVIKLIEKSNLTDANKREYYRKTINKYVENMVLNKDFDSSVKEIEAELQK